MSELWDNCGVHSQDLLEVTLIRGGRHFFAKTLSRRIAQLPAIDNQWSRHDERQRVDPGGGSSCREWKRLHAPPLMSLRHARKTVFDTRGLRMQLPGFGYWWSNLLGTVFLNCDPVRLLPPLAVNPVYLCRSRSTRWFEMGLWVKLASLYPTSLAILVALQTVKAFVLHPQPPSSLDPSQLIARAGRPGTVTPYTGNGAPWVLTSFFKLDIARLTLFFA